MKPEPQREESLFQAAAQLAGAERAAFLDCACRGDATLRARLEALLAAHDQPDDLSPKDKPAVVATMKLDLADAPDEAIGQKLGPYKLRERIGEGGCGVVYVADQEHPVRRRVALKVIKLGMDTKQVVARFESERQALAMMDHPNIAKVLDAGTTETGRPYFVMELVRGIRITDYCDQNHLSTNERLDLFIKICQAIQHAHQKGIIHRDIKPSNILVTLHDGVPVPKVIDFGIAKATEGRLTDATIYTQLHQFIGTPAYMSPEQAEMSGLDVDTRSDIYSLGVLLYELLAGSTPFDANELVSQGIDAMRKTIREKEPMRPSTRFATLKGEELTTTAKRRSADKSKLMHQLKGDLDWIVMKCLEKNRTRRYDTANGLAFDLKRHLNNEPVLARPPSTAYKFQKAFRRNKLVFTAGMAITAALILGVIGITIGLLRAKRAEALALQTRGDAEKLSNFMLEDFYTELEPSGQFEIVARLARQALAYYENLPATLRTPETERNRAMAQARLAVISARQGDVKAALPMASVALASFDRMREQGDRSEEVIYGTGLALFAESWCHFGRLDDSALVPLLQRGLALLKPMATSPAGSRRDKLLYGQFLDLWSHGQPPAQGVATAEVALLVFADLGALDADGAHLTEASAYADTADSEARESLMIGQLDDAERLEKQTQTLAESVLARRPGDLHAMQDVAEAEQLLSQIATEQFHDEEALDLSSNAQQAAENYLRFNPSDQNGWVELADVNVLSAAISFRLGRVTEALQKARAATERHPEGGSANGFEDYERGRISAGEIAPWESQRGNRAAAEQALQEARRYLQAYASSQNLPDPTRSLLEERLNASACEVKMALGENADACTMAKSALDRLEKLGQDARNQSPVFSRNRLGLEDMALEDSARAALNLGRYAEAETAARALLSLPANNDLYPLVYVLTQPGDRAWSQVLLAQAETGQGRKDDALKTLEPAFTQFLQRQAQGATDVLFRQRFARALYVQSLAEPSDAGGLAKCRDELNEADRLLQGLSDEARQLHDSKELMSWITAAQKKLNPDAENKQP